MVFGHAEFDIHACVKKSFSKQTVQTELRAVTNCLSTSLLSAEIDVSVRECYQRIKAGTAAGCAVV